MKKHLNIALILLLTLALIAGALSSCSSSNGVAGINWERYDSLIERIRTESDPAKKEAFLHIAEDWLMETECIVPIYNSRDAYLMKSTLTGVYSTDFGAKYFTKAQNGDRTDASLLFCEAPNSLDPAFAQNISALTLVSNLFSGLYSYDAEGNVVPELAESFTVSDDGLVYTFTLRGGLSWSNGADFGASDFVYSWRRVADSELKSPYAYLFDIIAIDEDGKLMLAADETDTVLTVTLKSPCDYFTDLCAFPALYAVNENAVEYAKGYSDIFGNVIDASAWTKSFPFPTSGAYVVSSAAEKSSYALSVNTRYYGNSDIKLKKISVTVKNSANEAYAMYSAGEIDFLGSVPDGEVEASIPNEEFKYDDISGVYMLCHNFNSSIYSGMEAENAALLRRAISLYIDREYIVSSITSNREEVATSIVSGEISDGSGGAYRKNTGYHRYPFMNNLGYFSKSTEENREEAREIIKKLGLDTDGDGKIDDAYAFSMTYLTVKNKEDIRIAQSIQQDLAALGIVVNINAVDQSVFYYEQRFFMYDMVSTQVTACYNDALSMLEHWITDADDNYAGLGSVVVEENENAY